MTTYNRAFQPIWPPVPVAAQAWRDQAKLYRHLMVEIGAGVGLHPIQYAQAHPESYVIAIEKTIEKFQKFAKRLQNHTGINNLQAVHANAVEWITRQLQPGEVDAYYILYPNPYPKTAQKNKRFMHMPFMSQLWKTLKVGGTLRLATNEQFYFEEAQAVFSAQNNLTQVFAGQVDRSQIGKGRTHFERKYLEREWPCYQLEMKKLII